MFHSLLTTWFHWVEQWGYVGVFVLMALESSIVPVPSEIVMPPAAFWAAQGQMSFWGVVLAGTAGSYAGSLISYLIARAVGAPVLKKYGKYFLFSEEKILAAEKWVKVSGAPGVFFARLLPVIRHLISIPAGIFRMPLSLFSICTVGGAGLWCFVLSWFGREAIGDSPELLQSPEQMIAVLKAKLAWFVVGAFAFLCLYGIKIGMQKRTSRIRVGSSSK